MESSASKLNWHLPSHEMNVLTVLQKKSRTALHHALAVLVLLCLVVAFGACGGGDDKINKTDRRRAVDDAKSSFGVIRTATLAYFNKYKQIPEKASISTFGIEDGQLRRTFYDRYDLELEGEPENGYSGSRIIARPKEGGVAPEMTMTFDDMRTGAHKIRGE